MLGKGDVVQVPDVRLHPKNLVKEQYPNVRKGDNIQYLKTVDLGVRRIRGENTGVVVLYHPPQSEHEEGFECWAKESSCHVMVAADPFEPLTNPVVVAQAVGPVQLDQATFAAVQRGEAPEDPTAVPIDDDNQPVPENIPLDNDAPWRQVMGDWGHSGSCERQKEGCQNHDAKINLPSDVKPPLVEVFLTFFLGKDFIDDVILPATNSRLKGRSLSRGEYLQWLGIWFLIATVVGPSQSDFWSIKPFSTARRFELVT